ncbi:MAG: 50S ribosomal protein L9 [Hyphomicrobiales bacterium]
MNVILLERVGKLGQMGDVVKVKDGYARNFLLPQGKALRANKANMAQFEAQRAELEKRNAERKGDAKSTAANLEDQTFVVIRTAGDSGQLYGSVSTRDIAALIQESTGASVTRSNINLPLPIKTIGLHEVMVNLHAEVELPITLNVARSEDEAERQARGEDVTAEQVDDEGDEEAIAPEEVFEDEALVEEAKVELQNGDTGEEAAEGEESASENEAAEEASSEEAASDVAEGEEEAKS